jgi:hypothetical protein
MVTQGTVLLDENLPLCGQMVALSHAPPWKAYCYWILFYCTLVDLKDKGAG